MNSVAKPSTAIHERRGEDPRLNELGQKVDGLAAQFDTLAAQHQTIIMDVRRNTELTESIAKSTSGLVDAWAALSGGFKVLGWVGKVITWLSAAGAAAVALLAAWHAFKGPGSGS